MGALFGGKPDTPPPVVEKSLAKDLSLAINAQNIKKKRGQTSLLSDTNTSASLLGG